VWLRNCLFVHNSSCFVECSALTHDTQLRSALQCHPLPEAIQPWMSRDPGPAARSSASGDSVAVRETTRPFPGTSQHQFRSSRSRNRNCTKWSVAVEKQKYRLTSYTSLLQFSEIFGVWFARKIYEETYGNPRFWKKSLMSHFILNLIPKEYFIYILMQNGFYPNTEKANV